MPNQQNRYDISRRKFVKHASLLAGGIATMRDLSGTKNWLLQQASGQSALQAVVLGDSAMWGQGLQETDKYSNLAIAELEGLIGRPIKISNFSHSGAPIREEDTKARIEFVDKYPYRFATKVFDQKWRDFDGLKKQICEISPADFTKLEKDFICKNIQDVAVYLYGEIPSSFPTVSYQVKLVPNSVARNAELVLLNGAANDLEFEEFLDPDNHRGDFVDYYDPKLKEIAYSRVKSLLHQTHERFPKAVIIYTAYFSPFAPDVGNGEIKDLLKHLAGVSPFESGINYVFGIEDIDQAILESQYRSQFGFSRSLYWSRKAIAELNESRGIRGRNILFIHPQFGPENTVFGEHSFFHNDYLVRDIKDKAKKGRLMNCPRCEFATEIEKLVDFQPPRFNTFPTWIRSLGVLFKNLNGPGRLLRAINSFLKYPDFGLQPGDMEFTRLYDKVIVELKDELSELNHIRIASFAHPNEKGAIRYKEVIVKRFTERHYNINLDSELIKFSNKNHDHRRVELAEILDRYNLTRYNTSQQAIAGLMLIDSIALEVTTAPDSQKNILDDLFLDLGGSNYWKLTFPLRVIPATQFHPQAAYLKILNSKLLEPRFTDLFTIDARGLHLSSLTQFVIERKKAPVLPDYIEVKPWKPSRVTLYLNGIEVFDQIPTGSLSRGGRMSFSYPNH